MASQDSSSLLSQFQNRFMSTISQSSEPPSSSSQPLYSPSHIPSSSGFHSQLQEVSSSSTTPPPFQYHNLHHRSLSQPSSFFHSLSDIVSLPPPFGNSAVPAVSRPGFPSALGTKNARELKTGVEPECLSSAVSQQPPPPHPHLTDVSMSDQEPSLPDQEPSFPAANTNTTASASNSASSALPPLSPLSSHHQALSRRHVDLPHHTSSSARLAPPFPSRVHRRSRSDTPSFTFDAGALLSLQEPWMPPAASFYQSFAAPASSTCTEERRVRGGGDASPSSQVSSDAFMKKETQWTMDMDTTEHLGSAPMAETDDVFSACIIDVDKIDTFAGLENLLLKAEKATDVDERIGSCCRDDKDKVSEEHGESFLDMASDSDKEDSDKEGNDDGSCSYNNRSDGLKCQMVRHSRSASVDDIVSSRNFLREGGDDLEQKSLRTEEETHRSRQQQIRHHHSLSMDGSSSSSSSCFNLKNLSSEVRFDGGEMKKTMTSDRLAELALIDPKRAKRILANRQSAARSKERKMRYISELERKVQTLQTEATTLSAQLTLMQRDSTGLFNENNELKLKLQAMEQQAHLREALNEALRGEVERLKLATKGQMLQSTKARGGPSFHHHQSSMATTSNGPHPSSVLPQMQQQQQQQQQQNHLSYPPPPPSI